MKLLGVPAYFLVMKLVIFIGFYNTEALPTSFLRTGRSLNPIEAIKKLLPERNDKTVIKLVPPPPGIHPLWKYDKNHGLIPVAINDFPTYGNPDHLAIYAHQHELEPPPTEYDPPYYHYPHLYEPQEPVVVNFPEYEAPTTEYGIPQEVYVPVNEYGPPKETPIQHPVIVNLNSGEKNDADSGIDALNALDAFGPLLDFLPDPTSDKNEEGNGNLAGVDLGALLEIASSLPEGSIEKLKALLGVYHAKSNQERLKNLFEAKNATLKLKAGALSSLSNFVQDTYKDSNKTSSSASPSGHGFLKNPFSNGIFNFPSHNHVVKNPFPSLLRGLFNRQNKAPSELENNIFKHSQNQPILYIQGIPVQGATERENSGGNSIKDILFGNYKDYQDTPIDSGIYKVEPNDNSEHRGIAPIFSSLFGTSRNNRVSNSPEPPTVASISLLGDFLKDTKVPKKIPFVFKPNINSNSPSKHLGSYVRVSLLKPINSYGLPSSTLAIPQKINSSNLAGTLYTLPSQETPPQFNSAQSYAVSSSSSVNSYTIPKKIKFSSSQGDSNSFQPISSYGVPNVPNPINVGSVENVNPLFNEVNSNLPSPYEEPYNILNHNTFSDNYFNPFTSYNASSDILVAASERDEQEVKPVQQQISGYSRVSLQNSQENIARNSSEKTERTNDAEEDEPE